MDRILYAYDPLCGWCYGFIPVMRAVAEAHPHVPIDVRMGGLVTGERIGPYSDAAGYIRGAAERMAEVTGRPLSQAFFERILTRDDIVSNSAQPCAAVLRVRERGDALGRQALAYAHALQEAHFEDAMDVNDPATHRAAMERIGLDMEVPDISRDGPLMDDVEREFATSRALGISSYPTVLVAADKRLSQVPLSYDPDEFLAALSTPAQDLRYGMPAGSPDL